MNPCDKVVACCAQVGLAVGLIVAPAPDNDSRELVAAERVAASRRPARVRERRVYEDKYQWWCIYSPGLDKYPDPAWIDHFYKGWGRMVRDDEAHAALSNFDDKLLSKLRQAIRILDACEPLSDTPRDVRDRIRTFYHVFATDWNLIEVQEPIHACLADSRERSQAGDWEPEANFPIQEIACTREAR